MAPHDSDASSDGGDSEYTETNVLLGYASKEPTDDTFSQLGGQPVRSTTTHPPHPEKKKNEEPITKNKNNKNHSHTNNPNPPKKQTWPTTPTTTSTHPPSHALTRCLTCTAPMPLLLQLNGDAPAHFPGHTRRLYVFGCRRKACARKPGSVRAVRAVGVDAALAAAERKKNEEAAAEAERKRVEEEKRRAEQGRLGSAVFGGGGGGLGAGAMANPFAANPFAASGGGLGGGAANPFASPASGLAAKPPQQTTTTTAAKEDEDEGGSLAETFAQKARIAASAPGTPDQKQHAPAAAAVPYEPWPTDASALAKPYPSYHLDADYETLSPEDTSVLPANAELDPNAADPDDAAAENAGGGGAGGSGQSKEEKQIYESLMDKTFQAFADRLAQNPEQVLRYEWRGEPLLYSRRDGVGKMFAGEEEKDEDEDEEMDGGERNAKVKTAGGRGNGMPKCGNCGAERVFEVQLTPQAIAELEAEELGLEGMEWGTVIVGVCAKDCTAKDAKDGEVGYVEEWVGVQWEEVAVRK
ncbi:pdcd2-c domain-containing protein [Diplodia corticola]|uniref:Pdcd2-c domain-containing protein n=1 Tax=Diplodia corticola TaxID=236234 RepID=A0A1J9RBR4_9PEZI|nr:pdcd2-c domain-containing protein [Diplodia corticola]OJD38000.1 pdcd2-c domain-containing protein [Diplodia corticola]